MVDTTTTLSITEFCGIHNACKEGRDWALEHCDDMNDAWRTSPPEWLIWVATRNGVLDDRTLRLFACWCVRQVWHLLTDERSRHAVEVAERFSRGESSQDELAAARTAAWAACDAACDAAWAARTAARAAACDAAWAAACDAAWAAAWAACDAACDAARAAARTAQADWLRENARPCFDVRRSE